MKCGTKKMASGGKVHSDAKMDKAVVKKAVHKHEEKMHPGKPKTKLASGGMIARGGGAVTKKGALKFVKNG
jgi:hypothetical protein